MARPLSTLSHSLLWPAILIAFAGWVIALGGLSGVQHSCNRDPSVTQQPNFSQVASMPQVSCHQAYRWPWYVLWFSLVPILSTAIAAAGGRGHFAWLPTLGMTVVASTLSMVVTNLSLNNVDAFYQNGGAILSRARTMFAGFLILSAGLLLSLFGIGAAMQHRDESDDESGAAAGGKRGYERGGGGGGGGGYSQGQQPTVTYGAPTGAAGGATRTTQGTPAPAV